MGWGGLGSKVQNDQRKGKSKKDNDPGKSIMSIGHIPE